jgi:predicted nucleotidyltransferase
VSSAEGLVFAVVDRSKAGERIPCFLRYARAGKGKPKKLGTMAANDLLQRRYPHYLFHCGLRDAQLHGLKPNQVESHLRPRDRVRELLNQPSTPDTLEARAVRLLTKLAENGVHMPSTGITGSLLAGYHGADSDIDLVFYDQTTFQQARKTIAELTEQGSFSILDKIAWELAYDRRGCSLSYDDFHWHEVRKWNKALFEGTKFDISLVNEKSDFAQFQWRKIGLIKIQTRVTDDRESFDYPSSLRIDNDEIEEVVSFTATYTGQARTGEQIEVRGLLEEASNGMRRIVIGSDREASGQYIKVIPQSRSYGLGSQNPILDILPNMESLA